MSGALLSDDDVFGSAPVMGGAQGNNQNSQQSLNLGTGSGAPALPGVTVGNQQSPKQNNPAQNSSPLLSDEDVFGAPSASMGKNATQPGYFTRVKNDLSARNDQVNNAVGQFGVGPTSLLAGVGKGVAGSVNDVLGETVKSAYNSLPDAVTKPINNTASGAANYIANTDAGKYMLGKAADASNMYKNFAAQNPATASDLESVGDIAAAGANLVPLAKGATEVAGPVVSGLSKVGDVASSTTLGKGIAARGGDELAEAANAIKANASAKYQEYRDAGAVLSPEAGQQAVQTIQQQLGRLSPRRQGDTFSVLEDLKDRAAEGNMSLEDLDDFRQDFRDAHNDNTDFTGRTTSDGRQASRAIDAMDTFVDNLGPDHLVAGSPEAVDALRAGQQQWSQYRKFDAVTNLVKQADGDPNKLKSALTRFMNKGKNTAGWSDDEIEALQNAARSTVSDKLLKTVGKFGIDLGSSTSPGNTFIPGAGALAFGAAHGAGSGAGLLAAGTAARQGAKWMARGKAENLLQTIEDNAHNAMNPPTEPPAGLLNAPPIYGGPPSGPPAPAAPQPQKLLPRGGSDTYYQPQGRALTYQPRADFEVDSNGIADKPPNVTPPAKRPVEGAIASRAGEHATDRNVKRLMITHQPRPDFVGTDNGITQPPSDRVGALLGEDQDMPIDSGELQSIRGNPRYPPGNARGGVINKKKGGAVFARPKSYPALEKRA